MKEKKDKQKLEKAKVKHVDGKLVKVDCVTFDYKFGDVVMTLMAHVCLANKEKVTISTYSTGLRLFDMWTSLDKLDMETAKANIESYKSHYTVRGILEALEGKEVINEKGKK